MLRNLFWIKSFKFSSQCLRIILFTVQGGRHRHFFKPVSAAGGTTKKHYGK